ncbi:MULTISPECIES: amino acid ABC transporter permease [Halocynthiibacter]|uniref:Amino acid ABC transporter permease n=1 Tax=Halocynthiibacter halioticoli TaxID=2986804 RepID=A0AAE3J450_9RHOB|nr:MULTISPECIES: amino acid ABC transporter permease [Halocynthiibacter]MCV6825497.1 amino acid ABC transporter permease [Halocynthiibacter halioticoli]MCW4058498.1 amino acid ABC transporter permease [Halocynthiibacter sp. SDUM655004]
MSNIEFVRTEMLPEKEPPASTVGPIGWMRENLFNGIWNSIITVLFVLAIVWTVLSLLGWGIQPTWNAKSLSECREIIAATGYTGHSGACWGVINDRWLQLLYGFYPLDANLLSAVSGASAAEILADPRAHVATPIVMILGYWRLNLAIILLFVGLAPVLIERAPRKLLIVTVLFPFIDVWLMWGGSIWGPAMAFVGFVLGYFAFKILAPIAGTLIAVIMSAVVPIIWWLFLSGSAASIFAGSPIDLTLEPVSSRQFGGFFLSISIGVVAILGSLPLGIVLALGRQSDLFIVKALCVGFIEFIRGVPLITLLFVANNLLNIFMPPGTNFDVILRVMIMVTLFAAAYMAEVVRGGLAALPKGQYEAADALGLDYWKAQRLIIMPQALKISIPGIVSTFIGVFKDTTLVSIISLMDPIGLSNAIRANQEWNGIVWELYAFIALLFFVVCFSMSRYSMFLERKLQTGHK